MIERLQGGLEQYRSIARHTVSAEAAAQIVAEVRARHSGTHVGHGPGPAWSASPCRRTAAPAPRVCLPHDRRCQMSGEGVSRVGVRHGG